MSKSVIRITVLGGPNTGKSRLIRALCRQRYRPGTTLGLDIVSRETPQAKLVFYDTGGDDRFRDMARSFIKEARWVMVVFNVADRQSWFQARRWLAELPPLTRALLVGQQNDRQPRTVTTAEAQGYHAPYWETSALALDQVEPLVDFLVRLMAPPPRRRPSSAFLACCSCC